MSEPTRIDSGYEPEEFDVPDTAADSAAYTQHEQPALKPRTAMDGLRASLVASTQRPPITLKVPSRNNVSIRCNTNIAAELVEHWQDRSQRRTPGKSDSRVDMPKFLSLVLANQTEAVLFDGQEVHDESGNPLRFSSKALADMLNYIAAQPQAGVRALFGSDGEMMQAGNRVLAEAGYDDVDLDTDEGPTQTS